MVTAEEGGATANTTASSYGGGGGAGGKFRKKPFRKPTTPYDRPPVSLRGNDSSGSWLTKLVVEPASKLISYGAHRLFASFSRKRLPPPPPPPPPQISELNHVSSNGLPEAVPNSQYGAQEPAGGEHSQPISSGRKGISELEHLLKQKTFTRSEIDSLTELLHSRAGEVSLRDDGRINEQTASDSGRLPQLGSSTLEANGNEGDRPHRVVSTPISDSKILRDSNASPAQLAKAYMGSRPSKASPSTLGNHNQVAREEVASKTFGMSLTTKTAVGPGSPVNGYITSSRSRGRSAIYNMSRSVYSKRSGTNYNGYAGLTMPSTSLSLVENGERSEPKSMTLKRRSYVLDDEVGSVGPIRRIRQKSNLMSPGIPHINGVGNDSDVAVVSSKQKMPLIGGPRRVPQTFAKTTDNTIPRTSYAQGPSSSSEVAFRILGHLEKLTPKEKSSGSLFKLTPSMLCGQALRSMEDMSSSELLLNVHDDLKLESRSNDTLLEGRESTSQEPDATLLDVGDYTSQEQGKVEDGPVESCVPSDTCYPVIKSDSAVTLIASGVRVGTFESAVENGVSQPQNKRAFRMSALEDYVDLDDDLPCNGFASPPFSGERGQLEVLVTASKLSPAGEPKLVNTTMQPEVKSPSSLMLSKTSELSAAASVGERSNVIINPASKEATMAAQSPLVSTPVFSFSSKVADKFPSLMPESSSRTPESSNSFLNTSAPTGSFAKIPEPEKDGHMKPLAAEDRNGKSNFFPSAASTGPLVSGTPTGSFTAASSNNTNQISAGALTFTPSTSVSNPLSSGTGDITLATSGSSIFGEGARPSIFGGPDLKFGAPLDPSTKVSTGSALILPAEGDLKRKAVTDLTANSVGTVSQGTSAQLFSFSSAPSSKMNGSTTSVSSLPSSQVFNPITPFGFNSSASSSGSVVNSSGATSSLFGVNPTPASDGSAASSSSIAAPSMFSFGFSSSSSSNNAVGSTVGATPPVFSFGMSSSVSASVTSATSSFSSSSTSTNAVGSTGAAAPIFSFGASSSVPASITNGTSAFSSSSASTNTVGSTGSATPVFGFGVSSSVPASVTNTTSSFSNGVFSFGGSSSASSSAISSDTTSNAFGSSWQTPKSSIFGSTVASASPANGFSFGASSTSPAPTNAVPVVFNSSTAPTSSTPFSFTTSNALSSPSPSLPQPVFGNPASGFAASPGNNDQMNAEDSMAEDPVLSTAPSVPIFGQTSVPPSQPGFMFGSTVPAQAQPQPQPQANPFQFGGQQNQVAPQNPTMFQASGSLEFNAGGSFSLGSGAGDKSGRKYVKINRSKNRKK